jgi:hypothetical protein
MDKPEHEAPRWLDDPKHVWWIIYLLIAATALVTFADFFYDKHGHYDWEEIPGFHAFYGFVCYVGLVLAATQMRKVVMQDEDLYDD